MIEAGALARLLMDKGVFTAHEYYEAIIECAQGDIASYTNKLEAHYGGKVTLG